MLIGYARVSTDDENLNLQRDALLSAGCGKIYEDHVSGAKAARPGLQQALEVARAGDVLVVWRLVVCQDSFEGLGTDNFGFRLRPCYRSGILDFGFWIIVLSLISKLTDH